MLLIKGKFRGISKKEFPKKDGSGKFLACNIVLEDEDWRTSFISFHSDLLQTIESKFKKEDDITLPIYVTTYNNRIQYNLNTDSLK